MNDTIDNIFNSNNLDGIFNSNKVEGFDFKKLRNNQENKSKMVAAELDELFNPKPKIVVEDNQLQLQSGKIITFNEQQYEGLNKIRTWLKGKQPYMVLSGPAGTGKSTIIKKILEEYRGSVIVSAPTHRAKKVIAEITNKQAKTLHSLLGLRMDVNIEEFSPNNPVFAPIALPQITNYQFVVIDEASQVNSPLLGLIKEKNDKNRTKVLFMGDIFQICPVNEKRSEVFYDEEIEKVVLTKIERQVDGNPLLSLYDDIRNNIEVPNGFLRKTNVNSKGEGIIFTTDKKEFRDAMFEKYHSEEFKTNINYVKTVAWKNDTVMASNKIIRTELFGKDTDIVELNDLLTGYRTITNSKMTYNIIENSGDYRIIEKSELEENTYGIKGYRLKVKEDLGKNKFKYDDIFIVNTNDRENKFLYAQLHDSFANMGKENKKMWYKYYDFRRNNMIMCDIDKYINGAYRNTKDVIKRDVDYGYSCTVHKIQGGTLNYVFVLETDINLNWVQKELNQIFYVAISRPTTLAYVLSNRVNQQLTKS